MQQHSEKYTKTKTNINIYNERQQYFKKRKNKKNNEKKKEKKKMKTEKKTVKHVFIKT